MTFYKGAFISLLFTICIALTALASSEEAPSALTERLDAVLERACAEKRLVGAVLLVTHKDNLVYKRAVGFADREKGLPMREDEIFRLASVTKPFTSMAAGVLLDKGMLKLDDPIAKQLPDFLPSLPDGNRPSITVRQLLSHTAGLNYSFGEPEDGPYHKAGVSDGADDSGLSLTENLRRIASAPLLFAPGSSWRYSLATDVLGAVVAKAYAKDLPQAVRELVTEPLGMRDAAFSLDDDSRLAVPYFINPPREPERMKNNELVDLGGGMRIRFAPNRILNSRAYPSGGAGMAASAQDVMRLLEAIRKQGAPLVSPEIMREMVTPQTAPGVVEPGWSFALGWSVLDDPIKGHTPQAAGTIAWGGVYGHSWFVDFTNGISVVLLTNTTPEGMSGKLRQDVRDAVYAELKK